MFNGFDIICAIVAGFAAGTLFWVWVNNHSKNSPELESDTPTSWADEW